jgi:hypothetical protein
MTTQNTSPTDSVLDYGRVSLRDEAKTESDVFLK